VSLETRVLRYPGFAITPLQLIAVGTLGALSVDMQTLTLTADQIALVATDASPTAVLSLADDDALMGMSLTEAKRLAASAFERRYLVQVMARANGSVSEGARLAGLDRTNFRRLLQRHDLR
jgi:transcriptional regulator with GAF, ATPase, and Fis domain